MIFDELTEVLDPEPHPAALNMALDEILLRRADGPILRVYRWLRPAVSFGYFGKFAEVERDWPGREPVRRWTGGGIVPHGEDLTYTVIAPRGCSFFALGPLESYERIHAAIASALRLPATEVCLAPESSPKISDACFENPARHDVLAGGKKIAGAAQRRTKDGLLHQGSILADGAGSAMAGQMAAWFSSRLRQRHLSSADLAAAADLAAQRYGTEEWLRRY